MDLMLNGRDQGYTYVWKRDRDNESYVVTVVSLSVAKRGKGVRDNRVSSCAVV